MCRIAGIIDSNRQSDEIKADVIAMCDAMAHGGPDDKGYHSINNHIVFGHRRLAIIDLSVAGHQPMLFNELSITYNGEIYNYKDLKKQLENLNFSFTTETDTEVIIIGFKAWGIELFNKLEGMFAFALHNAQTNETYLVRDQMGIKPLYYAISYGNLIFASEVKAFKQTTYLFEEDLNWQIYFLAFGHIPQPFTTLKNIKSLTGGSFLKWSPNEKTCQEIKFTINDTVKSINDADYASQTIKENLTTAVEKHLISDAPIGVFLSGGIDSSIITLLAAAKAKENLNTVSLNFAEADFSEEKYQKIITDQLVGKHTAHQINEKDFHANFEQIMNAMD
ncbi:MAG: asparagine synthase (glutamine-hydrolyzing), partial [Flavobacterium sp.]